MSSSNGFSGLFPVDLFGTRPCVVMDGGMGTTLQAPPFSQNIDSALWSSELLATEEGRETLIKLHATWIEAGAECIGSCSYQSFLPLFLPTTIPYPPGSHSQAMNSMLSALTSITSPSLPSPSSSRGTYPILSLGPFGALCQPGQEYSGLYPPPFGSLDTPSRIAYDVDLVELPSPSTTRSNDSEEDQLTGFHLRRLNDFVQADAWREMKLIAFETVPIVKEARAIRRAMYDFNQASPSSRDRKPFYISFVFPVDASTGEVKYPDPTFKGMALKEQAKLLVKAVLGEREGEENIDGLGVNCSNPSRIREIHEALQGAMKEVGQSGKKPWLVVYPDGGAVYDVFTKTWSNPSGLTEAQWASLLVDNVQASLEARSSDGEKDLLWGGVIAGGCCKAGPGAIRELRNELERRGMIRSK